MAKRMQEEKNEFVATSKSTAMILPSHVPTSSLIREKSDCIQNSGDTHSYGKNPEGKRRRNSKSDAASSSQVRLQDAYRGGLMDRAAGET